MYVLMKWIFRVIKNKNLTIKEKGKWIKFVVKGYYKNYKRKKRYAG